MAARGLDYRRMSCVASTGRHSPVLLIGTLVAVLFCAGRFAAVGDDRIAPPTLKGADGGVWWDRTRVPKLQEDAKVVRSSTYITMRDGVRIAADIYLPDGLPSGAKLPTILEQTRYHRSNLVAPEAKALDKPRWYIAPFVQSGYAVVIVDVRGTGASFGLRPVEYGEEEVRDGYDLVQWIINQRWSDGKVGAYGQSYLGTAAENLISVQHPAVKAAAIQFSLWDAYADAFPGGLVSIPLATKWGQAIRAMDLNQFDPKGPSRGVRPVDEDVNGVLLKEAVSLHEGNERVEEDLHTRLTFRDDKLSQGYSVDDSSPHQRVAKEVASRAPILTIDGYYDGGYPAGAIKRFTNVITPGSCLILGPWNHGARYDYDPDQGARVAQFPLMEEVLRFFDYYLKDLDTGINGEPRVHYFTMGTNTWNNADSWPPPQVHRRPFYLAADQKLGDSLPGASGHEQYLVDLNAHTAQYSRHYTAATADFVDYPDRRATAGRVLSFTSAPLISDVTVTGQGSVSLFVSSDQTDGQFLAYLEVVHPDGRVSYVTEGGIRALNRKILKEPPPYLNYGVNHSYKRSDALPMRPGEISEILFDLQPVSYLFSKGSRIRVSFAGADSLNFININDKAPTWQLNWGGATPSRIELPVADR